MRPRGAMVPVQSSIHARPHASEGQTSACTHKAKLAVAVHLITDEAACMMTRKGKKEMRMEKSYVFYL